MFDILKGPLMQGIFKKLKNQFRDNGVKQCLLTFDKDADEITFENIREGEEKVIISVSDLTIYQDVYKKLHGNDNNDNSENSGSATGTSEKTGQPEPETGTADTRERSAQ